MRTTGLRRVLLGMVISACLVGSAAPVAGAVTYDRGYSSSPYASQQDSSDPSVDESLGVALQMTVSELTSADPVMAGSLVSFAGEAIGEPIDADAGHKWVNVSGGGSLIGVYMTDEEAAQITNYGAYGVKGTELDIVGTFDTSCEQHGGDLDVHAAKVGVVSPGGRLSIDPGVWKLYLGVGLMALGGAAWILYRIRRRSTL